MKSIFNPTANQELVNRAKTITNESQAQWGKMNSYQMMTHCLKNMKLLQNEQSYKRLFIGRLFGKMALNSTLKNEKPMSKNSPTHPDLVIKEEGDASKIKDTFIAKISSYTTVKETDYTGFVHPFFGKMTAEQVGQWEYKHIDHHLRQFGA